MAEAHALPELVGDRLVADLVVDDAGPLPDPDEPRERHELGAAGDGQVDHGSALAPEQLLDDDAADPRDREARETEQADEEEFEREQLRHGSSLPAHRATTGARRRRDGDDHSGGAERCSLRPG